MMFGKSDDCLTLKGSYTGDTMLKSLLFRELCLSNALTCCIKLPGLPPPLSFLADCPLARLVFAPLLLLTSLGPLIFTAKPEPLAPDDLRLNGLRAHSSIISLMFELLRNELRPADELL
jgi:hypothetical protein